MNSRQICLCKFHLLSPLRLYCDLIVHISREYLRLFENVPNDYDKFLLIHLWQEFRISHFVLQRKCVGTFCHFCSAFLASQFLFINYTDETFQLTSLFKDSYIKILLTFLREIFQRLCMTFAYNI